MEKNGFVNCAPSSWNTPFRYCYCCENILNCYQTKHSTYRDSINTERLCTVRWLWSITLRQTIRSFMGKKAKYWKWMWQQVVKEPVAQLDLANINTMPTALASHSFAEARSSSCLLPYAFSQGRVSLFSRVDMRLSGVG